MKNHSFVFILLFLIINGCAAQHNNQTGASAEEIAFPGAEGYGKYTTGGRGGKVYVVSNLNDSGKGSFREAAKAKEPRIIVFAVSGTIHLESDLPIQGNVTIAGQTAPGEGICLADNSVTLKGDNVIIRYMRFRLGDKNQNLGKVVGSGGDDALGGVKRSRIMIDHCSMSWSTDEVASFYAGDSVTLQWNILAEPLNASYHFEKDTFEDHGYGGIWGGKNASFHHNLIAHCKSRTPRFDGIRNAESEKVDFRNNVIYNWASNNAYAGEGGNYNIVNNYYKYGPSTDKSKRFRIVNPYKTDKIPFGKFFVKGNFVDGAPEINADNSKGIIMNNGTDQDKLEAQVTKAFGGIDIQTETALKAYNSVLKNAGAVLPVRDTVDQRIVRDVQNRTGSIIDVQGGFKRRTPYEVSAVAWPVLKSLPAPLDSDQDGMPDSWELANGLNPKDENDSSGKKLDSFYTNVEVYINSLSKPLTDK